LFSSCSALPQTVSLGQEFYAFYTITGATTVNLLASENLMHGITISIRWQKQKGDEILYEATTNIPHH